MLKGSQLRSQWSDLAEFRTHSSSHVYHRYLQVWNESDQKRSRKPDDTVFPTVTLSVAMETSGRIWLNFELIQVLMHVLITCKYEKDQMKNSRKKCDDIVLPIISQWDFLHTLKDS